MITYLMGTNEVVGIETPLKNKELLLVRVVKSLKEI